MTLVVTRCKRESSAQPKSEMPIAFQNSCYYRGWVEFRKGVVVTDLNDEDAQLQASRVEINDEISDFKSNIMWRMSGWFEGDAQEG